MLPAWADLMLEARLGRSWLACWVASAGALLLASGCPGDDAPVSDSSSDDGAGTSTGPTGTSDATVAGTGSTGGTSTGATDSTGSTTDGVADESSSSSDTGPEECVTEPTETLPAVLEVSVDILNDTADTVYVLGTADGCTAYDVIRDGLSLPLALGPICGCECPPPALPMAEAVALDPGQSYSLTWDGRLLALYQEHLLCEPSTCIVEVNGSLQPLQPVPLTIRIPIYTEAGMYAQPAAGGVQTPCESPLSFSVEFELDTSDVMLSVALSEVVIR